MYDKIDEESRLEACRVHLWDQTTRIRIDADKETRREDRGKQALLQLDD